MRGDFLVNLQKDGWDISVVVTLSGMKHNFEFLMGWLEVGR